MKNTVDKEILEQIILKLLASEPNYFLVDIKVLINNQIKVFIDADNGVSVDKLGKINKALRAEIEGSGILPDGDFVLEVSSPGLGQPLKKERQYKKNIGRTVEVLLTNGLKKKGVLKEINEEAIVLERKATKKAKKALLSPEELIENIPFDQIKTTIVSVLFK